MSKNSVEAYGASGRTNLLLFDPDDLVMVDDPKHPLYDERIKLPVDERLVISMMTIGFFDPIIFQKDAETGEAIVVDGRQRVKAAREANKRLKKQGDALIKVSAIPRATNSKETVSMMVMAAANELRRANKPLQKAALMSRLLERGATEEDLVVAFGVSKATIKNILALNECTGVLRKAIDTKKIPVSMGYELAKLPPAEQKERLEKVLQQIGSGELKAGADDSSSEVNGAPPAPKTKKKRSGDARKAREIIRGSALVRGKKDILEKREELSTLERVKETHRDAMLAALDWVLGNDAALDVFTS